MKQVQNSQMIMIGGFAKTLESLHVSSNKRGNQCALLPQELFK